MYKKIKYSVSSVLALSFVLVGFLSCYDSTYEEFVPPTGNVNNIQPNTLFTTSTNADDNLSVVFRSYSTDAVSYLWDFGDGGTSTEANPNYTYTTGGLYKVKLTTTSSDGLTAVDSTEVSPMFVNFDFSAVDSEVTFENLTTGAKALVWDFGDGQTVEWSSEEDTEDDPNFSPVHIYASADIFEATLTATNFLGGEVSVNKTISGLVLSTVPNFTFITSSLTAEFTDSSLLAVSHSWDFGDGNTSTEVNPTHTYAARGTYDVTLTTTNEAGVSKSVTKAVPVGGIEPTFAAVVLNGTFDDFQVVTGDNADAWDMTPSETVKLDSDGGAESPSPYFAIWNNTDLNTYIDATYCKDEQPATTSDGSYVNGTKTRGGKFSSTCRRLYQVVTVEPGVEYTFSIDTRSEVAGINTEVFILNTEITTEVGIEGVTDAYFNITNDFNPSKGSATENTFTTTTFMFEPSSDKIVIYVRALNAIDSANEVFIDNVKIITPNF